MPEPGVPRDRRPIWLGLALVVLVCLGLFFWRGPEAMFTGMDIALHGGWSFVLVLACNFFLRNREPRISGSTVFSFVVLLGVAVEVVEFYLKIDFWAGDIVIDVIGALAGWAVYGLFAPFIARGRN